MRWPDLGMYGLELGVEDTGRGQRLALRSLEGRAVPLAVAKLGFVMDGIGRWVRNDLQLRLTELQSLFPRVAITDAPGVPDVRDADPLRPLREAMRRGYGAGVDVGRYQVAAPETAAAVRARAMQQLLGVETVWMRYDGKDPRLAFAGVTLRRQDDRTMFINVDGPFAAAATLGHEAVHVMRREQPVLYADLVQALRPVIDQPAFARYAARLNRGNAGISDRQLSLDEVREEAVADIVGDMLLDEQVWRAIDDRGLIERLLEFFKAFLERLAVRWQRARPELDGTLGSRELLRDLDAAREAVTATLAAWRDAQRPAPAAAAESLAMAFRAIDGPRPPAELLPRSAVRDADGRLQVVFRGEWGPEAVHAFDSTVMGKLPTFTTSPDVAAVYARGVTGAMPGRLRAVALDIRTPLQLGNLDEDVVEFGDVCERLTASGAVGEQAVREAWLQLGDRVRHWDTMALATPPRDRDDPEWGTTGYGPDEISDEDYVDTYVVADHPAFVALAAQAGFDGFHYLGTFTSPDQFVRPMAEAIADGYDHDMAAAIEWRPFRRDQVVGMFSEAIPDALRSVDFRRAYHGSPHAFERPDLAFVLSGEGNNAQGHGFYMAGNEGVADGYRKALSVRHRVFRLGDRLARRNEIEAVASDVFGAATVVDVVNICALLEEGQWRGDLQARFERRDEPERTQLLKLLASIEQIAYGDIAEQHVLLSHRDGSRALMGASMSAGYFVARREISHYLGEGRSVPDARARVIADQRQSAALWRAQLADDQGALRDAEQRGDPEALERIRLRVRDTRWFLQEAQHAATLLSDPGTLVFDVKGMVTPGHLYEGEISESALLLDWDVALDAQPEGVQAALQSSGLDVLAHRARDGAQPGMAFYRDLETVLGSAEAASDALMRAGVSGVRYRDGASRSSDGPPSWNYVIWNLDALNDFNMKFQRVFHGTPHRFEQFDTAHIGAGEGAQAYGWGLYFASLRDVAKSYTNAGATAQKVQYRGEGIGNFAANIANRDSINAMPHERQRALSFANDAASVKEAIFNASMKDPAAAAELKRMADAGDVTDAPPGNLYQVEIPEDSDLLDWDKPMARQAPEVLAKLEAHAFDGDAVIAAWKQNGSWPHVTGETLYRHLAGGLTFGAAAEGRHRDASLALQAIGIPGLRYHDAGSRGDEDAQTSNYVIWDAAVLGQATPALMQFRRADGQTELPFYSALLAAIERGHGAPRSARAADWKGWLDGAQRRGEFRQAERDWLGLDAWLDAQQALGGKTFEADLVAEGHMLSPAERARIRANPGMLDERITREQLATFVRAHQVQLQEVVYGGDDAESQIRDETENNLREIVAQRGRQITEEMDMAIAEFIGGDIDAEELAWQLDISVADVERVEANAVQDAPEAAKFGEYTLPGGENYRELLLTLPRVLSAAEHAEGEALFARRFVDLSPQEVARRDELVAKGVNASFSTPHFKRVSNILAHVRFNERSDADGKRVLFLEEIQSDWHQAGRKHGYAGDRAPARATLEDGYWMVVDRSGALLGNVHRTIAPTEREAIDRTRALIEANGQIGGSGVPDAPFKGTDEWAMLAFKRMLVWAAERGFDRIAWTTGAQQAERYELSKKIDELTAVRNGRGGFDIEFMAADGTRQAKRDVAEGELDAMLGKELAQKVVDRNDAYQAAHSAYREELKKPGESPELDRLGAAKDAAHDALTLSGVDLKVGGAGMKAFYDQILPTAVNRWARKFDAKAARTLLDHVSSDDYSVRERGDGFVGHYGRDNAVFPTWQEAMHWVRSQRRTEVHALDITPAMRDAALDGLPLFRRKQADNVVYLRDPSGNLVVQAKAPQAAPVPPDAVSAFNQTELDEAAEPAFAVRF